MPEAGNFVTKELTQNTVTDFERFFSIRPAPGAYLCWCMYHQRTSGALSTSWRSLSRIKFAAENRRLERKLGNKGRSHGILVYFKVEPVGWCQFGLAEELPHFDSNLNYRELASGTASGKKWRITCFTVEKKFRRLGGG
jgi:hypothetical protein